jgi:hypothetical protein
MSLDNGKESTAMRDKSAGDATLFYPGRNLSAAERARLESYATELSELTSDHIIYSLSRQVENNFQTFYSVAEDVIGEAKALELAFEIGRRYGGTGYATWLSEHGYGKRGNPETMARYQDLVHAIRGPKHTAALFAEYDSLRCVVRRGACIYFDETRPANGKYTGEFERGCFEGYKAADENIAEIVVTTCCWKGDGGCDIAWVFDEERMRDSQVWLG